MTSQHFSTTQLIHTASHLKQKQHSVVLQWIILVQPQANFLRQVVDHYYQMDKNTCNRLKAAYKYLFARFSRNQDSCITDKINIHKVSTLATKAQWIIVVQPQAKFLRQVVGHYTLDGQKHEINATALAKYLFARFEHKLVKICKLQFQYTSSSIVILIRILLVQP